MKSLNLDKIKAVFERVPKEFEGMVAQVGFPVGANYEDGTPVAYVAAIQEFGAPAVHIPPRPFMQPTVRAKKDYWTKVLANEIPKVALGKETAFDALDLVGKVAAADIQETITKIHNPALSVNTLAARRSRGNSSTKPLVDTGYMLASVTNSVAAENSEFIKV